MPVPCGDVPCGEFLPPKPLGMVVNGIRRSGKSNLLVYMLLHPEFMRGQFEEVYLMSPSGFQPLMRRVGWTEVIDRFDEDWIMTKVLDQKAKMEQDGEAPECLLAIDDSIAHEDFYKSKALKFLAAMGRHYRMSWIILTQNMKGASKVVRDNTDAMICFAMDNIENQYALYREWSLAGSWEMFQTIFRHCTAGDHDFLVIDKSRRHRPFSHNFRAISVSGLGGRKRLREPATQVAHKRRCVQGRSVGAGVEATEPASEPDTNE